MKKIDAHAHIGVFGGWAKLSLTADELIAQMNEFDIEKTLLCSQPNELCLDAVNKYPDRILGMVYPNPYDGQKAVDMIYDYVQNKGFKGIKCNPLKQAYVADDEIMDPIMQAAEDLDIPVFMHCGHPPYSLPWSIALLAERFPKVKLTMIHMGHGHGVYIDASLKMAKRYPNLYLEMSGMPMPSKIREAYEEVGHDRIMFGTDAPFHPAAVESQKVLCSGLDKRGMEDVFYNNAAKLMKLI
jgi:uncharacterized protein